MNFIRYYVEGRLLEWTNSLAFMLLGLFIFIWPNTINSPALQLLAWLLPPWLVGIMLITCGVICINALIINGKSSIIGPRIRSWTALLRAMLLLQFGLSALQSSFVQGFPYTVVPFWFLMAFAELWTSYRAVLDVRTLR